MSLLTPDSGLLFWMVLSFGIVVFLLCKFGFPVILKGIEARKEYIARSLKAARTANEQLAHVTAESAALLAQAREQQAALLKEAVQTKERIISEAREEAVAEGRRQADLAAQQIREEKERAVREARAEIAGLAVAIAEKVIRQQITTNEAQQALVDRLLDEMTLAKS